MARKKKVEEKNYSIDAAKLSSVTGKNVDNIAQYLEEHLSSAKITKDGSKINLTVPVDFSKRNIKFRVDKFLHVGGFKKEYRIISFNDADIEGYKIIEK